MGRLNWDKANRVEIWRQSERAAWSGHLPDIAPRATDKQLGYIQALLAGNGRRPLNEDELARLTIAGASRLISELVGE